MSKTLKSRVPGLLISWPGPENGDEPFLSGKTHAIIYGSKDACQSKGSVNPEEASLVFQKNENETVAGKKKNNFVPRGTAKKTENNRHQKDRRKVPKKLVTVRWLKPKAEGDTWTTLLSCGAYYRSQSWIACFCKAHLHFSKRRKLMPPKTSRGMQLGYPK